MVVVVSAMLKKRVVAFLVAGGFVLVQLSASAIAAGNIRIEGEYRYETPKSNAKVIPAADFQVFVPLGNTIFLQPTYWYIPSDPTDLKLTAPVDLPDTVALTGVDCFVYDNDQSEDITTNSKINFWEYTLAAGQSPNQSSMGTEFTTSGASANLQKVSINFDPAKIIDNSTKAYSLQAIITRTDASSDIRFYGCRAHFEYTQVNH